MKNTEKANRLIQEAIHLLREKPFESTLVERYFLLDEAWDAVKDLPQPLQLGKGLAYVLSKASLPITPYDMLLGRFDDHVPSAEEQERLDKIWANDPNNNPIVRFNGGHFTIDCETLVNIGIVGYINKTEQKIKKVQAEGAREDVITYLEGMKLTYEAIRDYIGRYGKAALDACQTECAEVCFSLTQNAPQTFREALQLILFIYNIYLVYAGAMVACLNVGRLDVVLLPLYLEDLKNCNLTEEDAGCLIDDFSAKMSLHLGRGEHQMAYLNDDYEQTGWLRNPVYESPGYITIGGHTNENISDNPLSILFAKHIHPLLKNPIYVCRYDNKNEKLWSILSSKVKENASLLLYNDETVIPAHLHIGIDKKDAINYSIHPCNWPDIAGGSKIVGICGAPLPIVVNDALHSVTSLSSMDELYTVIANHYGDLIKQMFSDYRAYYLSDNSSLYDILSLSECISEDCIENAGKSSRERTKYPALYVLLRNIGTAADMLSAVDHLVFKEKKYFLAELIGAADDDFENYADILSDCLKSPKFGKNNDDADAHAVRLMSTLLDVIDEKATNENGVRDIYTLNVTINDSNHLADGKAMNATVDGRRRGAPFTENLSPTVGFSSGVTDVLNSVSKLPFNRIHSGALNIRLSKSVMTDDNGDKIIHALIKSYFNKGGMQLQFSIVDTDELRKAQADPNEYRDLLVRITGYSAIFVDMSKGAQEEFIRREELK